MMIAFSLTNRPRLGQAKGGLCLRGEDTYTSRQVHTGQRPCVPVYVFTCFLVSVSTYESAHVGWTSMSIAET